MLVTSILVLHGISALIITKDEKRERIRGEFSTTSSYTLFSQFPLGDEQYLTEQNKLQEYSFLISVEAFLQLRT